MSTLRDLFYKSEPTAATIALVDGIDDYAGEHPGQTNLLDIECEVSENLNDFATFLPFGGKRPTVSWVQLGMMAGNLPDSTNWDMDSFMIRNRFVWSEEFEKNAIASPQSMLCRSYGMSLAASIDARFGPLTQEMKILSLKMPRFHEVNDPMEPGAKGVVFSWAMRLFREGEK